MSWFKSLAITCPLMAALGILASLVMQGQDRTDILLFCILLMLYALYFKDKE